MVARCTQTQIRDMALFMHRKMIQQLDQSMGISLDGATVVSLETQIPQTHVWRHTHMSYRYRHMYGDTDICMETQTYVIQTHVWRHRHMSYRHMYGDTDICMETQTYVIQIQTHVWRHRHMYGDTDICMETQTHVWRHRHMYGDTDICMETQTHVIQTLTKVMQTHSKFL